MTDIPSLASLQFISYLDTEGKVTTIAQGKIGVYAIFDEEKVLQYVGYSRDIYLSLKQHLARECQGCYWLKIKTIDKPSRTILEAIRESWIAENGATPVGNDVEAKKWNEPIDVKLVMTAEEKVKLETALDEFTQEKVLKNVARRVESEILEILKSRGVTEEIRFNPKLKSQGLLDLK